MLILLVKRQGKKKWGRQASEESEASSPLSAIGRVSKNRGTAVALAAPAGALAPGRSADFQSAVSPNCIRQSAGSVPRVGVSQRPTERNSATRQSATLRYGGAPGLAISSFAIRNSDFRRRSGWTLIESIAVMAVIAILAALAVPTIIRRVDRAAWTKETADLDAIGDAFTQSIIRTKTIPSEGTWASAVASQMSLPVSAISTNARRYARAFLIDQNLSINGNPLPYTQTNSGSTKPDTARVMIVSSLAAPLPIASGVQSSSDFNAIWNAPDGAKPSTWTTWAGTGDDLRIKKLNLEPLFHQLLLVNHDETVGSFSIDGSGPVEVPSAPALRPLGWNRYYLDGSLVGLHSATNLQTVHLLQRNISFIFESGIWRGQIEGGSISLVDTNASEFLEHATTFYYKPTNPNAQQGSSQNSVLIALYTFMFDYVFWATQCPHFDYHGWTNSISTLPEYKMLNDQGQTGSGTIDTFSGTGGLLK